MKKFLFYFLLANILFTLVGCNDNKISKNDLIEKSVSGESVPAYAYSYTISNTPFYFENSIIHGVTNKNTNFINEDLTQVIELKRGTNVEITNTDLEGTFEVIYNEQKGSINKSDLLYYTYNVTDDYSLVCDVSAFNHNREYYTSGDFELYILENDINYAIIRLGGRGYGKNGTMYYDKSTSFFVEACEYLGVPYGFYFLDESLNYSEVMNEVKFISNGLKQFNKLDFNLLPIFIDLEYQFGDGRADNIWNQRVPVLNLLIDSIKNELGIDTIIYANGARIETYIKDVNCNFWTAHYTLDNKIPVVFYKDFVRSEEQKDINNSLLYKEVNRGGTDTFNYSEEYLNKVVGWQFTENAASDNGIIGLLDLSLFDNTYISNYCISKFYN